jgi:hypothetical protein
MRKILPALCSALVFAGTAEASLVDRGGGMIYHSTLNVTWLADMNYAKTSGYASTGVAPLSFFDQSAIWTDGRMGWTAAKTWANNLVFGGFDDWRLPTLNPTDTSCSGNFNPGGGFPQQYFGYNCTGGELSHLFVADLGNKADQSILNQAGDTAEQIANLALFSGVQSDGYWSGTEYAPDPGQAWYFAAWFGYQPLLNKIGGAYSVAVRDGDVAASIPEPGTLALVGAALAGIAASHRRKPTRSTA